MTVTIRDMFELSNERPTGDVFAQFGEQSAPAHVGHSSNRYAQKHTADLGALEKRLRKRQRLNVAYLKYRSERRRAALRDEPRLRDFTRYLRNVPTNGDDLPTVIAASWLPKAPLPIRLAALELTTRRCDQINRSAGFEPLDDPLPVSLGGHDDTRARCAAVLYPAGRY